MTFPRRFPLPLFNATELPSAYGDKAGGSFQGIFKTDGTYRVTF